MIKVDHKKLSMLISSIRAFLESNSFFEVHLYSTTNYIIENTDFFTLRSNLFLRVNPEPDIWNIATDNEKFFWIGSMYRNESELSPLHSYEFTVADIYEIGDKELVKNRFIELLLHIENTLNLQPLSKHIIEIDYQDAIESITQDNCWIAVNNYPTEESFYDVDQGNGTTKKFELFYKQNNDFIEIAACGELGPNTNTHNFIVNETAVVEKSALNKGLVGFGIGLERLLLLYS